MSEGRGEILLYPSEDGRTRVDVRVEDGSVWLSQRQLAELYQKDVRTISEHIRNIFDEGELQSGATIRNFRIVQIEGSREVAREVELYNLDVILAVGYRVKSARGTQFRQWATERLREYAIKGFTMDDERLKRGGTGDYFDELLDRIRDIRASERLFYQKVLDIYATSVDYEPNAEASKRFFAAVQNKMHWAAHGHTAAEVVYERVDAGQPNVGMTHVPTGRAIRKSDVVVAKNYLTEEEWDSLKLIVNAYLEFAELQAHGRRPMHMAGWIAKLDDFLRISDHEILDHAGKASAEAAKQRAEEEFSRYRTLHRMEPRPVDADFERAIVKASQIEAIKKSTKKN